MSKDMIICTICKTPIEEGLEIETSKGPVHPGPCLSMIREQEESLTESVNTDEIQMIL